MGLLPPYLTRKTFFHRQFLFLSIKINANATTAAVQDDAADCCG